MNSNDKVVGKIVKSPAHEITVHHQHQTSIGIQVGVPGYSIRFFAENTTIDDVIAPSAEELKQDTPKTPLLKDESSPKF